MSGLAAATITCQSGHLKGLNTYAWFIAEEKGEYFFQCTEFCGIGHADMVGVVKVVSQEEYDEWINEEDEW